MAENNALWNWGNQQTYHEKIKQEIEKASTGGITIDDTLSTESTNAIQNKVVATKFEDCFQSLGGIFEGSIKDIAINCEKVGASAFIGNTVTDMPLDNSYWFVYITGGGTSHRCITAIQMGTGKTYQTTYNNSTSAWQDWFNVANGGNATTINNTKVYSDVTAINSSLDITTVTSTQIYTAMPVNSIASIKFESGTQLQTEFSLSNGGHLILFKGTNYRGAGYVNCYRSNVHYTAYINGANTLAWVKLITGNDIASATANGLMSTGAQTFGGNKTFNGQILPNGATAYGTPQARKMASGTAAATTTNCPSGAWYGKHS